MNGIKTNWTSHGSMKITGSEIKRVISAKLQIGERHKKTELTGRSLLRRQRSTQDCCAIKEEEEKKIQTVTKISIHATSIKN